MSHCNNFNPMLTDRGYCHSFNAESLLQLYQESPYMSALTDRVFDRDDLGDKVNVTAIGTAGKYSFKFDVLESR